MANCKLLLIGSSKAGKTGALCSLADAGRRIGYLDFDNNAAPLRAFCKTAEGRKNIQRVACLDETVSDMEVTNAGEIQIINRVTEFRSWPAMIQSLKVWPADQSNPREWGNESVLVIDSLSALSAAAERGYLKLKGRSGQKLKWQEFGELQKQIFEFLVGVGNMMKCPVIVISHLQLNGPDLNTLEDIGNDKVAEALQQRVIEKKLEAADIIDYNLGPISIGKAKSQILPSVFSGTVFCEADETGRWLFTKPRKSLQLGVPVAGLPAKLPIETGLVTIMDSWAPMKKKSLETNVEEK